MPLTRCPVCDELCTIRKAPVRFPGQREAWKVAEHDATDDHGNTARCKGVARTMSRRDVYRAMRNPITPKVVEAADKRGRWHAYERPDGSTLHIYEPPLELWRDAI